MSYSLGIDLGTTFTAAAVSDGARTEMLAIEHDSTVVPSVVAYPSGSDLIVGAAAVRRARTDPDLVVRDYKRRLGDPTPFIIDGRPRSAEQIMASVVQWVVTRASAERGAEPDAVALAYPANWGGYKQELLGDVVVRAGLPDALFIPEPTAAAWWYAEQGRIEVGDTVGVFDFGGGTFDAVVLRRAADGFGIVGRPGGVERLGGIDLDEELVHFALQSGGLDLQSLDGSDPAVVQQMSQLRDECRQAKEALSADSVTEVLVDVGPVNHRVRITRAEFEDRIRPTVDTAMTSFAHAVSSAGLEMGDLSSVLLVGGSSRVPLVAETVGYHTGRPVTADVHSKHAVALGAALAAAASVDEVERPSTEEALEPSVAEGAPIPVSAPLESTGSTAPDGRGESPSRAGARKWMFSAAIAAAVIVVGMVAVLAFGGGSDEAEPVGGEVAGLVMISHEVLPAVALELSPWTPLSAFGVLWIPGETGILRVEANGSETLIPMDGGAETPIEAFDRVWVPNRGGDTVTILAEDGAVNAVVTLTEVTGNGPIAPVAVSDAVWVSHDTGYARIDAVSLEVDERSLAGAPVIRAVGDVVWVLERTLGLFRRHDFGTRPSDANIVVCRLEGAACTEEPADAVAIDGPHPVSRVTATSDALFFIDETTSAIYGVSGGEWAPELLLSVTDPSAPVSMLAAADGDVWYGFTPVGFEASIRRVAFDGGDHGEPLLLLEEGEESPQGLLGVVAEGRYAWVAARNGDRDGTLYKIDRETDDLVQTFPSMGRRVDLPVLVDDEVWVVANNSRQYVRVVPSGRG